MKTLHLAITPEDAQILELNLRDEFDDFKSTEHRPLLLRIGACLVTQRDRVIDTSEEELWCMRDCVDPTASAGKTTGLDVITKIYKVLCEHHQIPLEQLEVTTYNPEEMQLTITEEDGKDEG